MIKNHPSLTSANKTVRTVRKDIIKSFICFTSPLQSALLGYNSSPWGKLYSEWHLTPHRRGQCAVILLRFLLTDSDIFERCRADLRNQSVPGAAHQAVFCFMLCCLLPPPNVIMPPTHPITRSHAAREAKKGDVDKDACATAKDTSPRWGSRTHTAVSWEPRVRGYRVYVRNVRSN